MSKKKICLFSSNSDLAGAPNHVYTLARFARSLGHEVVLVFGSRGDISIELEKLNFSVLYIDGFKNTLNPLLLAKFSIRFLHLLRVIQPCVVHAHSSMAGLVAKISCAFARIPLVFTIHGFPYGFGRPRFQGMATYAMDFISCGFVDKYVCVSQNDLNSLLSLLPVSPAKTCLIRNTVSDSFVESNVVSSVSNCSGDCIMIARVHKQKDHLTLFKALRLSPFSLTLVGEGTDSPEFIRSATSVLGDLVSCVKFLGPRKDIHSLLSSHKIALLISMYESLPISLLEALSVGRPIIATNCGDNSAIVSHESNGYLVPVGDFDSLSKAIGRLLSSPEDLSLFGASSAKIFACDFSRQRFAKDIFALYSSYV